MLKFTQVGQANQMMLDEKDVLQIFKGVSDPYVVITSKTGPNQYVVTETMSQLQVQVAPNLLIRVTQIDSNGDYMFYAHDIKTFTKWKNTNYTRLVFYSNKQPIIVTQTFAQIQAALSVSADNFIASIVYQDPDVTPTPTSPNYPNLLSNYNNGTFGLTDLTGLVNYISAATGSPFTIANTLFVSANGNNGTAIIGRLDKTWADPWAAIAAAAAFQTVVIFPGLYSTTSGFLIKNAVTTFAFPGVRISYTDTAAGSDSPFATTIGRNNGVFRGYADIIFAKQGGAFDIGGYVDSALDIEVNSITLLETGVLFAESLRVDFKAAKLYQIGGALAGFFLTVKSTISSGTVKQYKIDINDARFNSCTDGISLQDNIGADIQLNIQGLRYLNLANDLVLANNPDCETTNINVNIENVYHTGLTNGGFVVNMPRFGNDISGSHTCTQKIAVKNIIAILSAMSIGDTYTGLTQIELSGILKMTDISAESPVVNSSVGVCEITVDLVFDWAGATAPILISEFNGESSGVTTSIIGTINVIGKASGDAAIFNTPNNAADYMRVRNLEVSTGADYIFGNPSPGAVPTTVFSSYCAAVQVGVGIIDLGTLTSVTPLTPF